MTITMAKKKIVCYHQNRTMIRPIQNKTASVIMKVVEGRRQIRRHNENKS